MSYAHVYAALAVVSLLSTVLLTSQTVVSAIEENSDPVIIARDSASYKAWQLLENQHAVHLVLFYDSIHVKSHLAIKEAQQAAQELGEYVTFATLDVRDKSIQFLLGSWNILGSPTIALVVPGGEGQPNRPILHTVPQVIAADVVAFTLKNIPSVGLTRITSDKHQDKVKALVARSPCTCLFFSTKSSTPPLVRSVAISLRNKCAVVEVTNSKKIAKEYGVDQTPAIVSLSNGDMGLSTEKYNGEFRLGSVLKFLHKRMSE